MLIERLRVATGLEQAQVVSVVDAIFETIVVSVADGESVRITGFGEFVPRERQVPPHNLLIKKAKKAVEIRRTIGLRVSRTARALINETNVPKDKFHD